MAEQAPREPATVSAVGRLLPNVMLAVGATVAFLLAAEVATRMSGFVARHVVPEASAPASAPTSVPAAHPPQGRPMSKYRIMAGSAAEGSARKEPRTVVAPMPGPTAMEFIEPDPVISWRLVPGFRDANTDLHIDSHGLRGDGVVDDGAWRLLLIGDSVTFGWAVGQTESYAAQLERLLTTRCPERAVRVLNAGVPGYTLEQGEMALASRIPELHPDGVVIAFANVDRLVLAGKAGFVDAPLSWRGLRPVRRMLSRSHFYVALRYEVLKANAALRSRAQGTKDEQLARFEERLVRMVRNARSGGRLVILLGQPHVTRGNESWNAISARVAEAEGAVYVPVPKPFEDPARIGELLLTECHPSPRGHALVAEALAAAIACPGPAPR